MQKLCTISADLLGPPCGYIQFITNTIIVIESSLIDKDVWYYFNNILTIRRPSLDSNAKALSGLSYLSIFFLPFVLPIIVYFATNDAEAKRHAKRAFISQILIIVLSVILVLIIFFAFFFNMQDNTLNMSFVILLFVSFILIIGAFVVILIWSIVQGIKVIR